MGEGESPSSASKTAAAAKGRNVTHRPLANSCSEGTAIAREHQTAWGAEKSVEVPTDPALSGSRSHIEREGLAKLGNEAENAYKTANEASLDRNEKLKRCVLSSLNKICPENVERIVKRIKDETNVCTQREMELIIDLILNKALVDPHHSKTYADAVVMLTGEMPSF